MASKEAVAGGVVLAGGGAGGGYAAYNYMNSRQEVVVNTDGGAEAAGKTPQKIEDHLESIATNGKGKPITKLSNGEKSGWWDKAFHRYFLEIERNDDKIDGTEGKADRTSGDTSKKDKFKSGCESLLSANKNGDDDKNLEKARKWCVTYETLATKQSKDKSKLKADTDTGWDSKYSSLTEGNLKTLIDALKNKISGGDDTSKQRKAVRKWCEMALDASESYSDGSNISNNCLFNS